MHPNTESVFAFGSAPYNNPLLTANHSGSRQVRFTSSYLISPGEAAQTWLKEFWSDPLDRQLISVISV